LGEAQERGIVGETPNLAARLQGIAEPNMVVIGDSTRRLLGNLFESKDLGAKDLKGIVAPMRAWAALRPSSESRFEALHTCGLTALVGREEELEMLLRRWSKVKAGEGQVVLLSGEAGIGKSRLAAALLERLTSEPHTRLRYFCSPQHADSALYPIIRRMERAAGIRTTMGCRQSSTSSMQCWRRVRHQSTMRPSLRRCCRCQMTDAIPARSRSAATAAKNTRGAQSTDGGPIARQSSIK
jgi:AAA ATPase domain